MKEQSEKGIKMNERRYFIFYLGSELKAAQLKLIVFRLISVQFSSLPSSAAIYEYKKMEVNICTRYTMNFESRIKKKVVFRSLVVNACQKLEIMINNEQKKKEPGP